MRSATIPPAHCLHDAELCRRKEANDEAPTISGRSRDRPQRSDGAASAASDTDEPGFSERYHVSMVHRARRRMISAALVPWLVAATLSAAAPRAFADEPPPPPPPQDDHCCPPPPPPPVFVAPGPPRPLSDAAKTVYFPFYATGLILRYGLYYLFVAPFEVFGRALSYGVNGGVEPPSHHYQPPPPSSTDPGLPPPNADPDWPRNRSE